MCMLKIKSQIDILGIYQNIVKWYLIKNSTVKLFKIMYPSFVRAMTSTEWDNPTDFASVCGLLLIYIPHLYYWFTHQFYRMTVSSRKKFEDTWIQYGKAEILYSFFLIHMILKQMKHKGKWSICSIFDED